MFPAFSLCMLYSASLPSPPHIHPFCLPPQVVTAQPSHMGHTSSAPPPPNSYLVWSIISIVFCCWPLGLVALIFSIQVNSCACDYMRLILKSIQSIQLHQQFLHVWP